ncbi:hypothetical protein AGMMS49992_17460 [Clostridia bacterium]|nr:hypothetical protein AGMMS49992_17460 [Clostridia bacterium]
MHMSTSNAEVIWTGVYRYLRFIYKVLLNLKYVTNNKKLIREESDAVLILGNGPSLNCIDIDRIIKKGVQVICVNFFPCRDGRFFSIKPRYLCLIDPVFFSASDDDNFSKKKKDLISTLEIVDWQIDIIVYWGKRLPLKNACINYIDLSTIVYRSRIFRCYIYERNIATMGFHNVIACALFFTLITNAKEVYLAGVDNTEFLNYEVDKDNDVYLVAKHSYGTMKAKCYDIQKGEFYKRLACYCQMFEEYHYLSQYAKNIVGARITNLNPYSFVDVFDKSLDYYTKLETNA